MSEDLSRSELSQQWQSPLQNTIWVCHGQPFLLLSRSSVEIMCNSGTLIFKKWCEFWPTSLVWQSQLPALLTVHFSVRDYVPRSGGGWHAYLFICFIFKLKHVFRMLPVTLLCWEDPSAFHSLRFSGPWSLCWSLESIYCICLWPGSHSCYYKHIAD